jgi:hypothetical protein
MQGPWGVLNEPEPKWWIEPYPFNRYGQQLASMTPAVLLRPSYKAPSTRSTDDSLCVEGWVFRGCYGPLADVLVRHAASAGMLELILKLSSCSRTSYLLARRLQVVVIACRAGRNMDFSHAVLYAA